MIRTADLPCTGCGSRADRVLFAGREHEYAGTTDEEFRVVRCGACGLVRLNPRPDVSELATIYPPDYYAYNLIADDVDRPRRGLAALVQKIKRRMYQARLTTILAAARFGERPIRLLDIGCGDGRLLDWYKSSAAGSRIETHGIDMNERAVGIARQHGHSVALGRFEEARDLGAESFDLILSNHVIEHVADPRAFLARARDLLAPGGVLVLETPNFDSADVRRFGRHWGGCHFPRHWTFFDARTIAALADTLGLAVERVEYQANPIFWNWSAHSWLVERRPWLADRLFPPVAIFHSSPRSFALLSLFTTVDLVLKAASGRTASMAVTFRRAERRGVEAGPSFTNLPDGARPEGS